ncbi:hypothetical protein BKA93DRAFT_789880 [Sparassis latifolia]
MQSKGRNKLGRGSRNIECKKADKNSGKRPARKRRVCSVDLRPEFLSALRSRIELCTRDSINISECNDPKPLRAESQREASSGYPSGYVRPTRKRTLKMLLPRGKPSRMRCAHGKTPIDTAHAP